MNNFLNKKIHILIIISVFFTGCTVYKPYAKNPYYTSIKTDSQKPHSHNPNALNAAGVGLAAASRSIPGALPVSADIGIASAALLLGGGGSKASANYQNFVFVNMPSSMAIDEEDAQVKVGSIVEKGIKDTLQPEYRLKVEEYDDHYAFGKTLRPRWLRVDGPLCENWSCQIIAPIPTKTAFQWEGKMDLFKDVWRYDYLLGQSIAFVKITKEFAKDGKRFVEGVEIENFNYDDFFRRLSEKLPEWMGIGLASNWRKHYTFQSGQRIE